ncbi:MAG: hypothetical protein Q8Q88_01235 [Phenylobacterium sp.]|uniref:hypothetical protein n=1 Tax=Phenylobacterium sp. TaxID=1871053 RepID=UPI0027374FBF|nr:hypothetical protein [Phenylobacterium sp.]MDP3745648.1 hypothetical protein [Phenylobacterium sp.]
MIGEVIRLPTVSRHATKSVRAKLQGMISIFHAIDDAELLAALPECALARANHIEALNLLSIIETELDALCRALAEPS